MDKYTRFANTWKAIGVTSKVRWHQQNTVDRLNAALVKRLIEKYGDEVKAIAAEVSYQIGLEDGRKICENLRLDPAAPRSALIPLETVSVLSGVDSEVTGDRRSRQFPHLTFKASGCIYGQIFEGMDPAVKDRICEQYTQGLVHAVDKDAQITVHRKCCAGNRQCEFTVSFR